MRRSRSTTSTCQPGFRRNDHSDSRTYGGPQKRCAASRCTTSHASRGGFGARTSLLTMSVVRENGTLPKALYGVARQRHLQEIAAHQFDALIDPVAQIGDQRLVDLHGNDPVRAARERQRQRAATRTDFHNQIQTGDRRAVNQPGRRRPFTKKVLGEFRPPRTGGHGGVASCSSWRRA